MKQQQVITVQHYLSVPADKVPIDELLVPGAYVRSMLMPKGLIVEGAAKKEKYVTMLLQGAVLVHEQGKTKAYVAPCMFESASDQKRHIEALELTVLATVHGVASGSLADVENEILCEVRK